MLLDGLRTGQTSLLPSTELTNDFYKNQYATIFHHSLSSCSPSAAPRCLLAVAPPPRCMPARRGRLHRAGEPPRRHRGLAARWCRSLVPLAGWANPAGAWTPCVVRQPGEGPGGPKRSWPLPGYATILGRRLAETGCSPLYSASHGRRVKNACYKHTFLSVSDVSEVCCKYFRWMLQK